VCARLDGIPLALELAAARAGVLAVPQIAARLDDCLRLLTGGSRAGPTRQQTLRTAMDWSYALLTAQEQALLDRLGVFAGGFDLEAAEAVGAGEGIAPEDVLDLLTRLIDKSLVVAEVQPGGAAGYRLLEPLRQYARTHLAARGAADAPAARHAAYFLHHAEAVLGQWGDELHRPAHHVYVVLARLAGAVDDLRAALAWFVRAGDVARGGRLGAALGDLWLYVGQLTEGRQRLAEVLALPAAPDAEQAALRVKLLEAAALLAWQQGDFPAVAALRAEQLAISQRLGDLQGVAAAANWLGVVARERGELTTARRRLEESRAAYEQLRDRAGLAIVQDRLGTVLQALGDADAAGALYRASAAAWGAAGQEVYLGWSLLNQALLAADRQDLHGAARLAAESLGRFRRGISEDATLHALGLFAHLAAVRAQTGVSGERGVTDIPLARHALQLQGAVDGLCAGLFVRLMPSYRRQLEPALAAVRRSLPADEAARLHAQGQAMTLEQTIAAALAAAPAATPTTVSSVCPAPVAAGDAASLTRREQEVAALLAAGCHTDRQLAARLAIAPGTAGVHVQRLREKLGLRSRWQVAAWANEHGLRAPP
jgi:non-specific serine/threonine protein kinase